MKKFQNLVVAIIFMSIVFICIEVLFTKAVVSDQNVRLERSSENQNHNVFTILLNPTTQVTTTTQVKQTTQVTTTPGPVHCSPNTLNPPKLFEHERKQLNSLSELNSSSSEALSVLSAIVQEQIKEINSRQCSDGRTLLCGHWNKAYCGFACQVHHRIGCVMMSYAMNLPLIHDAATGWGYSTGWNDVFEPMGSNCTPDNQTYNWTWSHTHAWYTEQRANDPTKFNWNPCNNSDLQNLDFPLAFGIAADEEIENYVARYTSNPDKWWIGQFIGYGVRLNSATAERISKDKDSIGLNSDCIGLQVRRTDKITEYRDSFHNLSEYFDIVVKKSSSNLTHSLPQVYLASDEPKVHQEAVENFPDVQIVGYPMTSGYHREDTLYEAIRDIALLHSCKHIVCGFSSNMCRLLYEMLYHSDPVNADSRLTSLDGKYSYILDNIYNSLPESINNISL